MEQAMVKEFQNLSLSPPQPPEEEKLYSLPLRLSFPQGEFLEMEKLKPPEKQFHSISVTFSFRWRRTVDDVAKAFDRNARAMQLIVWGPGILPIKVVNTTTTFIPPPKEYNRVPWSGCNHACSTELMYHGRVVELIGTIELVKQMISDYDGSGVDIEYKIVF
ncbi:small ribosomal subunit protein uS10y-like [Apium graveolens]|uniref:small ribosomal subunit protein uS10y-like n=1 Tax=Apium graveolens TaxID=4045 RepID=UPI003D7A85D6